MELYQALENIKRFKPVFAEEEIHCIREHRDEAIPVLLGVVQNIADNPDKIPPSPEEFDDPTYAIFLLAEFRVNDAFEPFIKILEFDEETAHFVLGDMITEGYGRLIASVAHENDIDRLKQVIENTEIHDYHRTAALEALIVMHAVGAYSREELVSYLGYLLSLSSKLEDGDDGMFTTFLVSFCRTVDAKEHFDRIMELYDRWMIDRSIIQREEFTEESSEVDRETGFKKSRFHENYTLIADVITEMQGWACFSSETEGDRQKIDFDDILSSSPSFDNILSSSPSLGLSSNSKPAGGKKVGRNDPCPCGSGKKYKKCCLNKG
ncbi:MAG: DUF1186 domain-containing protein [Methanomicrobiales archaeon]|jgi:hypothetical protein|nr:DUF1186 domain-containing protein [Methanomicrobiales archaeon]